MLVVVVLVAVVGGGGGVCEVKGCGSSGSASGVVFCSSLSGSSFCSGAVMVVMVVAIVVETFYRQHSVVFCLLSLLLVLYSSCPPSSCRAMSVLFILPHGPRCLHLTIRTYMHTYNRKLAPHRNPFLFLSVNL